MPSLLRSLLRARTYTLVSIATLGGVVGAVAAIFTIVSTLLIEPLPYFDPARIVMVWIDNRSSGYPEDVTSYPSYLDLRAENETLEELAAYSNSSVHLTGEGEPERLAGSLVSATFFPMLGVEPLLGRYLAAEDEFEDALSEVVLSFGLWNRRFGGSPSAVGQSILLDGAPFTVVGVMPASFRIPENHEFWLPLTRDEGARYGRDLFWLHTIGRLKDGVEIEEARADLAVIMARIEAEHFPSEGTMGIVVNRLHEQWTRNFRAALILLAAAVTFLWLIACSNLAGLALARGGARAEEFAIRQSLGAGRGRLVGLLAAEGAVIGLLSVPVALVIATLSLQLFRLAVSEDVAGLGEPGLGADVLVLVAGVSILSGILFSLAPAIHLSARDLVLQLKTSGFAGRSRHRTRRGLVVAEVALSLALLVGALLLARSFQEVQRVPVGFDADNVHSVRLTLPRNRYTEPAQRIDFYERVVERVRALPGVDEVAAVTSVLHRELPASTTFTVEGVPIDPNDTEETIFTRAAPGYFDTMRIPILRGRDFDTRDEVHATPAVIINETMAKRYWPGLDPVGRRMAFGTDHESEPEWLTVMGVVGDVRQIGLDRAVRLQTFVPLNQAPGPSMTLVVRTPVPAERLSRPVREAVWQIDPELPVAPMTPVRKELDARLSDRRHSTFVLALFAGAALFLAAIGVYGVLAYSVSQRSGEMGLRMAFGARAHDLILLVLRDGFVLVALGLGLGIIAALPLRRLIAGLLFGISPFDPVALIGASALLAAVGFVACYFPARRAARVDPSMALRNE